MYIKSISSQVKDCFMGRGWENWVRLECTDLKSNTYQRTAGMSITKDVEAKISDRIRHMEQAQARRFAGVK